MQRFRYTLAFLVLIAVLQDVSQKSILKKGSQWNSRVSANQNLSILQASESVTIWLYETEKMDANSLFLRYLTSSKGG